MVAREQVVRDHHGLYRAWTSPDLLAGAEDPDPGFHGIQVVAKLPPGGGRALPGAVQSTFGAMGWVRNEGAKSLIRREEVGGRTLTFEVHPATGSLVVSMSATSAPLRAPEEVEQFGARLAGYLQALGVDIESPTTRLVRVEMNRDYHAFALKGVTDISWRVFKNAWSHFYQKHKELLRMELQIAPVDLSLREGLDLMRTAFAPRPRDDDDEASPAQMAPPAVALPATPPGPASADYGMEVV